MWIEENRLYANAPPGEYAILLTAQRGSDPPLEVALGVRVPVAEIPLGDAPEESVERDAEGGGIEEPHENELPPSALGDARSFRSRDGRVGPLAATGPRR